MKFWLRFSIQNHIHSNNVITLSPLINHLDVMLYHSYSFVAAKCFWIIPQYTPIYICMYFLSQPSNDLNFLFWSASCIHLALSADEWRFAAALLYFHLKLNIPFIYSLCLANMFYISKMFYIPTFSEVHSHISVSFYMPRIWWVHSG